MAVSLLTRWNGRADRDAVGMALFERWQEVCREGGRTVNVRHILTRQKLGEGTKRALLECLAEAAGQLKAESGRLKVS